MDIPLQREPVEDEVHICRAERDCHELAAFRITRTDRLGERMTYVCATHRDRAEYATRQRFPGWGEPRVTVTLAIPPRPPLDRGQERSVTEGQEEPESLASGE